MKITKLLAALVAIATLTTTNAFANDEQCSTKMLAGKWVFATQVGRQMLPGFPPDKDITAIGTMNIGRDGGVTGEFDVTVQDSFFLPGIPYSGTLLLDEDCTGTLTFVTGAGSARTDSVAVVGRDEIRGMSQDPLNLWTYEVRRLPGGKHDDDD